MDVTALRAVFEMVATPQLVLEPSGVVVAATQDYLRAIRAEREAVIGRSVFELPPYTSSGSARRELANAFDVSLRSGVRNIVALHDVGPCASGMRFSRGALTPVSASEGSVIYVVHGFEVDARVAQDSSAGERRLRKLIENSYETIGLVDARGMFTFVCGIERVLGFSEQEWLAMPGLSSIHPEDVARFGAEINQMLGKAGSRFCTRVRALHKDGSWRVLECSNVNRLDDPEIAAIVITFRDVTKQIAMQEDVRRSEERLRVALTAARALCWDLDLVRDQHTYSQEYAEYFGLASGHYDGRDALLAVHPDDRALIVNASVRARGPDGVFSAEFRGMPREDGTRWYASHGQVFRDEQGNAVRMVGVTWDVSERRRMQDERRLLEERLREGQKLESLGVLAGGIAHDFNNLLMVVLGNASLLEREVSESVSARGYLQQIEEASRRASDLCQQLLAYAGKGQCVLSAVDLNSLVENTTHLLQVSISKNAALRYQLCPELPSIEADATQLRQVLMNLVLNASEAIGAQSGVIAIRTGTMKADRAYLHAAMLSLEIEPGDFVYLEVSDTGAGMSEATKAHIFEPFFSTKFTGRGLGLAAVLGIVRGHKGAMHVHSVLGQGSSFRFLLPIPRAPLVRQPRSRETGGVFLATGTILLVDDEETIRSVGSRMLESLGFRVLTARDGRDAIEVYRAHRVEISAVLMDLTMPRVGGEESVRELRRITPELRVLLMSGYNQHDVVARLMGQGLKGFLQKPFTRAELESALRAALA